MDMRGVHVFRDLGFQINGWLGWINLFPKMLWLFFLINTKLILILEIGWTLKTVFLKDPIKYIPFPLLRSYLKSVDLSVSDLWSWRVPTIGEHFCGWVRNLALSPCLEIFDADGTVTVLLFEGWRKQIWSFDGSQKIIIFPTAWQDIKI